MILIVIVDSETYKRTFSTRQNASYQETAEGRPAATRPARQACDSITSGTTLEVPSRASDRKQRMAPPTIRSATK